MTGSPPFGFRWRRNGATIIPFGQGTPTLTLTNAQVNDSGVYTVVVTNIARPAPGLLSSNALVTRVRFLPPP